MKNNIISILIIFWMSCSCIWAQQTRSDFRIKVNGQVYDPQPNASEFISKGNSQLKSTSGEEKTYLVMQFMKLPSQKEIKELKEQGIELLNYLQNNAYYASISSQPALRSYKSKALENLYSVFSPNELNKINRQLQSKPLPAHALTEDGNIRLVLIYLNGVTDSQIDKEILKQIPFEDYKNDFLFHQIHIIVAPDKINELARIPWIINISPTDPQYELYDRQENVTSGILRYNQDHPELTGKGIKVGIWDSNVEKHVDLTGRVHQNWTGYDYSSHGIHVAGILAGAGWKDATAKGAAPNAALETYNYNSLPPGVNSVPEQMLNSYLTQGISITQNSYGYMNTDGIKWNYSYNNANTDIVANMAPELLHVYACGNNAAQGAYWSTGTNPSKNTLQVANLAYTSDLYPSSSRGPDLTGQIFPHVSAVGYNIWSLSYNDEYETMTGTSMSCPLVSGMSSLIYEKYAALKNKSRPQASLVKALICNGATDLDKTGPDYNTGFGEVNMIRSLEMLENNQYFVDSLHNTGEIKEFKINIPEEIAELKVMLVWNDPYGLPGLSSVLVNDLDLEVVGNKTYLPYVLDPYHPDKEAVEGVDNINVLEQIVIPSPKEESIKIRVKGTALPKPAQTFSIVYSFVKKGITLLSPVKGDVFITNNPHLIKWTSSGLKGDVTVESSTDEGKTYKILTKISGKNYISLQTRNEFTKTLRIRVSQEGIYSESVDVSVIGRPDSLKKDIIGGTNNLLRWNKAIGAASYEILRLNKSDSLHFEVIGETTDTIYTVPSNYCDQPYWFSVRAKNGAVSGMRAVAVELQSTRSESDFPVKFDFESKVPNLYLKDGKNSICTYRTIPEINNAGVLYFTGNLIFSTYTTSDYGNKWKQITAATANQAWALNPDNISSSGFKVNLPSGKKALLKLKIRIKSSHPYHTFFRVLSNNNVLPDATGKAQLTSGDLYYTDNGAYSTYYNTRKDPVNEANYLITRYYDLSAYEGQNNVEIRLEGLCATARYEVNNDPNGSQIYIDDLEIVEQKASELIVAGMNPNIASANALQPSVIKADVVNVGYETAGSGKLKLMVNYLGENTSDEVETTLPALAPWTLKNVEAGTISWKTPESHKLTLIASGNETGSGKPDTCVIANIESKDKNIIRMDAQVMVSAYSIKNDTTITDFGTSFYPYLKFNSLRKANPFDKTKRLALAFSEMDLAPGDTIFVTSGEELLGKYYGNYRGDTCKSTSFDSELTISLVTKGGDMKEKGWIGRYLLMDKPKKKDLKLWKAEFTANNTSWSEGLTPKLYISNEGSDTIPLDFRLSYRINGGSEVIETPRFISNDASSAVWTKLPPGSSAYAIFQSAIKGTGIELNKNHNITFKALDIADEDASNDSLATTFFYGNRNQPSDMDANGFIRKFSLGNYNYESELPYYVDNTADTLAIAFGQSYPYQVIIDGFEAKNMNAVFYIDLNKNGVFEDDSELFILPGENNENRNTYAGEFVAQAYFTNPGVYGFRVASYENSDRMAAVDYTMKVTGTPINNDVELEAIAITDSLYTGVMNDLTLKIKRYFPSESATDVSGTYSFINNANISAYTGSFSLASLKKGDQNRTAQLVTPDIAEGNYKLKVTVSASDNFKDNNVREIGVFVKKAQVMYTTSINGGMAYSSEMFRPQQAAMITSEYPDFSVSNMNEATWVKDTEKGIDHWFMLSEQFTRKWDNKVFYENKLVRFDPGSPKAKYVPLNHSFNSFKIYAIAFDASKKILYGLGSISETQSALYKIDYVSGEATYLRNLIMQDKALSGLTSDLHGNLFSVNKTDQVIIKINPDNGNATNYCSISELSSDRYNLAYDFNAAQLYLAYEKATGENVLAEAIPTENRTRVVQSFSTVNQPYCLAIPMLDKIKPDASNIFSLESFNAQGQIASVIDNERKEVTVLMPESADLSNVNIDYYFANGNAVFYKGANLIPTEGSAMNLSIKQVVKAQGISPNTQSADWTIDVVRDTTTDIYLTDFRFKSSLNSSIPSDIVATITPNGVTCTVPYTADMSALIPSFTTNVPLGAENVTVLGKTIKSDVNAIDVSTPALLNLKSNLMRFERNYKVEVTRELSPEADVLTFILPQSLNEDLAADITAEVSDSTITLKVPAATSLSGIIPAFTLSNYSKMYLLPTDTEILSGVTPMNLADSVIHVKVISEDQQKEHLYKIIIVSKGTGIEENTQTNLQVYPNPVIDKLHINSKDQIQFIMISDMNGQIIYRNNNKQSEFEIATDNWTRNSYYIIQVKTDKEIKAYKIIKN